MAKEEVLAIPTTIRCGPGKVERHFYINQPTNS